jgi:hypothetical protein
MSEDIIWLCVLIPSAIIGIICGYFIKKRWLGVLLAGTIPFLGVLGALLFEEYIIPQSRGSGASMWQIALAFVGTIAAGIGIGSYYLSKSLFKK